MALSCQCPNMGHLADLTPMSATSVSAGGTDRQREPEHFCFWPISDIGSCFGATVHSPFACKMLGFAHCTLRGRYRGITLTT